MPSFTIYSNASSIAFLDINPIREGHTLVIPRNHSEFIWDLKDEDYIQVLKDAKEVAGILQSIFQSKTVGLAIEGLSVPHTHIHLIPIEQMNQLDPTKARPASKEELERIYEKFKRLGHHS